MVEDAISGAEIAPSPSSSGCYPPASLLLARDGPISSWLVLLWYSLSPLFCEWARQCLRLELFMGKFSLSLSLSIYLFIFLPLWLSHSLYCYLMLAPSDCPHSGPSGHSGPVLTLSSAACTSLFSPCLLVADLSIWATSLLRVTVRHIICGLDLFFPPSYVDL